MLKRTRAIARAIVLAVAALSAVALEAGPPSPHNIKEESAFKLLPGQGKKIWVDDNTFFTYAFNEKPKMGMIILKVQVFNKKREKITPFIIKGRSDMPSMRGAHDSGDQDFKFSRRRDYLLPVNIAMPGGWEIRLTLLKGDKPVFLGRLQFDV